MLSLTWGTRAISSSHHSSGHISHWLTGLWTSLSNLSTLTDTPQGSLDSIPSQSLSAQRHCLWLMSQALACRFRWLCISKLNINIPFEISFNEAPRNFYRDLSAILLAPSDHQSGNQKSWQPETRWWPVSVRGEDIWYGKVTSKFVFLKCETWTWRLQMKINLAANNLTTTDHVENWR